MIILRNPKSLLKGPRNYGGKWMDPVSLSSSRVWRRTFPQVCVDAHVACCSSQTLVFPVWDVFFGLGVDVLFGQPEVDDVDGVLPLAARPAHQEVLRLDVPVDQTPGVNIFHPCDL